MIRLVPAFALVGVVVAGCSGAPVATPLPTAASTSAPPSTVAAIRLEVQLTDVLRMQPSEMRVPAGVPVTFVVTNAGALEHEFYLGDEEAQDEHEDEMAAMPGMTHDEPAGIGLAPGETKELTYTFAEPGETLAGCHIRGHYPAGMKAVITIE